MKKNIITIVGGGAVGVSLLHQLIKLYTYDVSGTSIEINLIEKKTDIGRGLAYADDDDTNLLNRPANTMSAAYGDINDFYSWLYNNKEWKAAYSDVDLGKDLFLPRSLFGLYMQSLLEYSLVLAKVKNIKINVIHDEVVNVICKKDLYCVETAAGNLHISHAVVLSVGQAYSSSNDTLRASPNYFDSPYPTSKLAGQINKNSSVAIIGSRLSAIDTALSLNNNGHVGKMAFISRNGYIPSIRPNNVFDYKLKILTSDKLKEMSQFGSRKIPLKQIIKIIDAEASLVASKKMSLSKWMSRSQDSLAFLEGELSDINSRDKIIWQSVLISINSVIELIWDSLSDRERRIFVKRYKSRWMAYRVSIPSISALKIYSLIRTGSLECIKGLDQINYDDSTNKFIIKTKGNLPLKQFDCVINATGSCSDIHTSKSLLINNLKASGQIRANRFGGIDVDFDTSRVKKASGAIHGGLYAVGNLTEGVYFFTSVLELNIKHVNIISNLIIDGFKSQPKNKSYLLHSQQVN